MVPVGVLFSESSTPRTEDIFQLSLVFLSTRQIAVVSRSSLGDRTVASFMTSQSASWRRCRIMTSHINAMNAIIYRRIRHFPICHGKISWTLFVTSVLSIKPQTSVSEWIAYTWLNSSSLSVVPPHRVCGDHECGQPIPQASLWDIKMILGFANSKLRWVIRYIS